MTPKDIQSVSIDTDQESDPNLEPDLQFEQEAATKVQVHRLMKEINTSKAMGISDLKTFVVKDALLNLPTQLIHIINESISTPFFPMEGKKATVIPIPKPGNPREVSNYIKTYIPVTHP